MKKQMINIKTDVIKLEQLIKYAGLCVTGGQAKMIIAQNCISVNEKACNMRGKKIYPGDTIKIEYENEIFLYEISKE